MSESRFSVTLTRKAGYQFVADFGPGDMPTLRLDEPPPLGQGLGPNPARLLAAAIGDCLSASLLYCLQRARVDVDGLTTTVEGEMIRNKAGRHRIGPVCVTISPNVADPAGLDRCRQLFEDFCVVTQSVREGIDVAVTVQPAAPAEATIP